MKKMGKHKIPGDMLPIVTIATGLQQGVRCIHGEEQGHEDDLRDKDIIGIAARPAVQVMADKTTQLEKVPAQKKDDAKRQYAHSQHFKCIDKPAIQNAKAAGKKTMGAKDAVQPDLQHFQVDVVFAL